MPTTLNLAVKKYLQTTSPAQRTREEYATTLRKWSRWGTGVSLERLSRAEIRDFLDWVHQDAASRNGGNPGRTANKVRSHLRAVLSWAWEQDVQPAIGLDGSAEGQGLVADAPLGGPVKPDCHVADPRFRFN